MIIYKIIYVFICCQILLDSARWEAGNSLKMMSSDVGTFSNIENLILRTFILYFCEPILIQFRTFREHFVFSMIFTHFVCFYVCFDE